MKAESSQIKQEITSYEFQSGSYTCRECVWKFKLMVALFKEAFRNGQNTRFWLFKSPQRVLGSFQSPPPKLWLQKMRLWGVFRPYLNRRWCIWSPKQITEIIHLWWGETNYISPWSLPAKRHPLNPLPGATVTTLTLDAVLKTKSCVPHCIFYFFWSKLKKSIYCNLVSVATCRNMIKA